LAVSSLPIREVPVAPPEGPSALDPTEPGPGSFDAAPVPGPDSALGATGERRPLIVTEDTLLLDDLLRLAAAAGVDPEVAPDAGAARRPWGAAPLVLVGDDVAAEVARLVRVRREAVVLVGRDMDDAGIWERAVSIGAETAAMLPDAEAWLVERLADVVEGGGRTAEAVCVVGGRGGGGASTLAAALAVTGLRRDLRAMLVDGDPLGGGIDLVFGSEDASGLRWPDLAGTSGRVSGRALRDALPRIDGLDVLSWDRGDLLTIPPDAMRSVLAAGRRTHDLVVVDLPRRVDAAADEALSISSLTLLVVPAEVRAVAAAARVARVVGEVATDVRLVVRGPGPSGLSASLIASVIGLPLAGELRPEPGLESALERGEPPARRGRGPLAEFCGQLLEGLLPPGLRDVA
jgi:secretion/DNA translocation related CpaE-like protein